MKNLVAKILLYLKNVWTAGNGTITLENDKKRLCFKVSTSRCQT